MPIGIDCGDDLLIACDQLEDVVTERTTAIMAVHIYGRRCDMDRIAAFASEHRLRIVEDCAESHGVAVHPDTDAACWSFYKNKLVAGQEGGAVAFKDSHHAAIARELRCQGFTAAHDFLHRPRGFNARLSNANADLIRASLENADANIANRRAIEEHYDAERGYPLQPYRAAPWVYDINTHDLSAIERVKELNARDIPARMAFKAMSEQTEFRGHFRHLNAYRMSRSIYYLPLDSGPYDLNLKSPPPPSSHRS